MAWDSTRPVPWRRLVREAAIFLVVGGIVFALISARLESFVALVVGVVMFVGFSAVLAKFGYQRQTLRELRANAPGRAAPETPAARARPAPTRRTSTGPSQRPNRSNKARRR